MTHGSYSRCVCGAGKQCMLFALQWIHKWKLHCASIWRVGDGVWKETKGSSRSCILTMLYHSAKRLTHPACRLTFQHTTCVRFLNQTDFVLLCESDCVFEHVRKSCMPASSICKLLSSDPAGLVNAFFVQTCAGETDRGRAVWMQLFEVT